MRPQQFEKGKFLQQFDAAGFKEKVRMAADLKTEELGEVYPAIKDSLYFIKKRVYYRTNSNEAKFLFDLIDAKHESGLHQYHKTVFILENGLRFHTKDLADSVKTFELLSLAYMKLRNYNKAFEIEETYEKNKSRLPKELQKSYIINKSIIFLKLGLYSESVKQLRKEFSERNEGEKKDSTSLANFYNDLGVHFNKANSLDSAAYFFMKAKDIVDAKVKYDPNKMYFTFFSALIDGNMASIYAKRKQFKEAIAPLKKDIYYSKKVNNIESAANSYNLIAECYLELKQYDIAHRYIDTCKQLLAITEELAPSLSNMLIEARYYTSTGNYKKANEYFDRFIRFRDSITRLDNETQLINQQVAFDLFQKENLLIEKEKIIRNSTLIHEQEKTHRSYLISGIVVLLFAVLFLIINAKNNQRRQTELFSKNKHIIQQKNTIEATLKEKEFLMKEIHHRVKNNLQIISSMLNLQADKITNSDIKGLLQEGRQRINSMALIHQMLYNQNNMSYVSICNYLNTLVTQIERAYHNPDNTVTQVMCEDIQLDLDTAIPLGLIVNELVTNAHKHAFKNKEGSRSIIINLSKIDSEFVLLVKDNGVGFTYTGVSGSGLGMELISMLSHQLNGKLEFINKNGTAVKLSFPA
ncbi:MAG: tetratricopeptide repeat-containing sensor histidine kinase [Bacteroidia bacterium]